MHNEDLGTVPWIEAPFYWAQGFLVERLGITLEHADRALRAHAKKSGRPLLVIAHDVVQRGLLLDPEDYR